MKLTQKQLRKLISETISEAGSVEIYDHEGRDNSGCIAWMRRVVKEMSREYDIRAIQEAFGFAIDELDPPAPFTGFPKD